MKDWGREVEKWKFRYSIKFATKDQIERLVVIGHFNEEEFEYITGEKYDG